MKRTELEERLISFSTRIIEIADQLTGSPASRYYADQMVRSSGSSALNYGEAQAAETYRDFIHKNKIVLKELRETIICLKIVTRSSLFLKKDMIFSTINEADELISIFVATIKTAQKNHEKRKDH
jgi:four helix bundle protein